MGRFLAYLLGLAALGYGAYVYVSGRSSSELTAHLTAPASVPSAPKRDLDNARRVAKDIEQDAQRRADELFEKTK